MQRRRLQREDRQKSRNKLNRQNNISARTSRFFDISLPPLYYYDGKIPYFTFYEGSKQATATFSVSFWTWIWFLGIQLEKSSLALIDKVNELAGFRWLFGKQGGCQVLCLACCLVDFVAGWMSQAGSLGEDGLLVGCGGWFNGTDRVGGWFGFLQGWVNQDGYMAGSSWLSE